MNKYNYSNNEKDESVSKKTKDENTPKKIKIFSSVSLIELNKN